MSSTLGVIFAVTGLLSCLCCVPPLLLQIQTRNAAVAVLIASVLVLNAIHFVNALIWPMKDPSDGWDGRVLCDIEVKLRIGLDMTIPGGTACLFRRLCLVLDPDRNTISPSRTQTRNTIIFETTFCAILPILRMILVYIVQPDRYLILGIYGCTPTIDTSWPSYALVLVWPLIVCLIGLVYGGIASFRMARHWHEVSKLLYERPASQNKKRTLKLFLFAFILFAVNTPNRLFIFYSNRLPYLEQYSWTRIHPPDWSQKIEMANFKKSFILSYAANTAYSIIIFALIGCGPDVTTIYRTWLDRLRAGSRWFNRSTMALKGKIAQMRGTSGDLRATREFAYELGDGA